MTHGPEYRVRDGKRPAWLDDGDFLCVQWGDVTPNGHWRADLLIDWRRIVSVYLKDLNHWANAPIAAGLEPYRPKEGEGDGPPADFKPGGRVMFRNGGVLTPRQPKTMRWRHDGFGDDIIGYERTEESPLAELQRLGQEAEAVLAEPEPIDWTGPLVAEHRDTGEVRRVEIVGKRPLLDGDYELETALPGERVYYYYYYFKADGSGDYPKCPWRIRNARPGEPGAIGEVKPAADADGSRECRPVADDPIKRMIEEIAKTYGGSAVPIRGAMRRLIARIREDYAIVPLMTEAEAAKEFGSLGAKLFGLHGILRPEPTLAERFTAETGHKVTPEVLAALEWMEGK